MTTIKQKCGIAIGQETGHLVPQSGPSNSASQHNNGENIWFDSMVLSFLRL